jgi:hypothetical protein
MNLKKVVSINNVIIRLTSERWKHIIDHHPEMEYLQDEILHTVRNPDMVYEGERGEYLAVRKVGKGKFIVVVYREETSQNDGFIITAFITKRKGTFRGKTLIWERKI